MTILFIISLVIFLASLGAMALMVVRKIPALSSLNVYEGGEAREVKVKAALLEQRLRRELVSSFAALRERLVPFLHWMGSRMRAIKAWGIALEARYQQTLEEERRRVTPAMPKSPNELLGEAATLMEKEKYEEAEASLVRVIALEPKSIPAFKLLARLYTMKREFDHVREVDEFLLKIDGHQADVYADLGISLLALGDPELALDAVEKAVELEEGNPKYLDQLLELAILLKRRSIAESTLKLLEEANPENEKIPVFATRIKELPRE